MGIICILETWIKRNRYCSFPKDVQLLSGRTRLSVLSNEIIQVDCLHSKPSEVYYAVNSDKKGKNFS